VPGPRHSQRQKLHVLRGLGGMGKTQLAIEFARQYHYRFSSVFWLDGRNKSNLVSNAASRVAQAEFLKVRLQRRAGCTLLTAPRHHCLAAHLDREHSS
jgi:adenylylsulfate kinase-like enzyme